MRKFARYLALGIIALTSAIGLGNIPGELRNLDDTLLQQSVQLGGALHSVLGVLVVIGSMRRKRWAIPLAIVWSIVLVYTAGMATIAWEPQRTGEILVGTVFAGISCALIGWWVVWAARESVTRHIPATADSSSSSR